MSKSAQSHQAAQPRGIRRFVPVSIKPIVVKLTRKLSVTYWPGRRRTISGALLALLAGFVPSLAAASPTGSRVVSGSAVVSHPNASTTLVTQGTQNAIINWQNFSIGVGEGVRFVQPSASAVALNRVVGNDPSRIFGSLSSNGKVFLVNTAGVYFAPGASVDVGGLVASSMNISDRNFMAGKYEFEGGANGGAVDNQGMLRGAFVVLAAPQVSNSGSIVATGGAAALAAGGRVSLDIAGDKLVSLNVDAVTANAAVTNSGSISADGGKVFMSAHSANAVLDTVINTSGVVRANSIGMRDGQIVIDGGSAGTVAVGGTLAASGAQAGTQGGSVAVLGDRVSLQAGASVDVSGDAGGGSARIGGDFHGAGALKTASQTQVEKGASINADAITSGNGGTVAVWSDQHTAFAGSISAKGGAQGGDGGFVETSGKHTLAFSGAVTTRAAKGASGTLLLDPTDITITTAPTASASNTGGSYTGSADSSNINDGDLTTALGSTNVIVDASGGSGSGAGNITVSTPITWASSNSLTLKASANIDTVGGAITSNGGGAVSLYGNGAITTGAITTHGGIVEIAGTGGGISQASSFAGSNITSNNGNVSVQANGAVNTGAINSGSGTIKVTGNSAVTIDGALASTNPGTDAIVIKAGAQSSAGSASGGDILITAAGLPITVSGSGRATLYTGSVAGSSGVSAAVGNGNFRYGSDEATVNYSAPLGTGVYAVYRESPLLTVAAGSATATYGDSAPSVSANLTGLQNGDTQSQALSANYTAGYIGANSGAGLLKAGSYAVTASGAVDQLGYSITYTPGTLTVAPKSVAATGLSVPASKVYDGTTTASVSGTPGIATEGVGSGSSSDSKAYSGDVVSITGTPSGTYDSKDVATATAVQLGGMNLGGADAANYVVVNPVPVAATITPRALTASVSAPDKAYDGTTTAAPALVVTGGLVGSETVTASGAGTFNSKDVASASMVTVNSVSLADGANGGMAGNYSLGAGGTATAHITPATLTATLSAPDKAYDGSTTASPTVVIASGLIGSETVNATGTASFNSKDVTAANQVTLDTAALADGSNGGLASNYSLAGGAIATAHITPRPLTATVAAPDKVYDGTTTAAPTLTITGGLVGAETVNPSGTANFNTKDVSTANLVTVVATTLADGANGGLASNYSLAAGQTVAAHVTPKALVASASSADKVYDGTTAAPASMDITGGLVGAETLTAAATGNYDSKDVLTATQVTINSVTLQNGTNGGLASNYSLAAPGAPISAHITPKALSMSGLTATNTKVYDGNADAAVAGAASLDSSEAIGNGNAVDGRVYAGDAVGIAGTPTGTYNSKDVVSATTIAFGGLTLSGADKENYSLTMQAPVAGTVTPRALSAAAAAPDKVYDGATTAAPTLTVTAGLVGGEIVTANATGHFDSKDVATASLVTVDATSLMDGANGGLASNYSLASGQSAGAHITAKALTASVMAPDKVYDGGLAAAPTLTITSGLVGGETVDASGTASFNGKDVASASRVTVDSTTLADGTNGGLASNYSLAAGQTVSAHVIPKAITATATAPDKAYDGNVVAAPTLTTAGLVGAETVVASATGTFNSKNVLDANLVTVGGVSLADGANGGLASNYSLGAGQTVAAHITPKVLAATASAPDKVYDASVTATPILSVTAAGLIDAETVTATANGTFNSKDVASAGQVTVNGVLLHDGANGGLASNYSLAAGMTTSAHITQKSLSMSGLTAATTKTYDGNLTAAVSGAAALGAVEAVGTGNAGDGRAYVGDNVTIAGAPTGTYNSKDVTSAGSVAFGGVSLAGADKTNYSLTIQAPVVATITPRALNATVSAPNKIYDGLATASPSLTITGGLVGAETVTATGTATFNTKDVPSANLVTVNATSLANGTNGGLATNYSLAPGQTVTAHITRKLVSMSGLSVPASKVYDANPVAAVSGTATLQAAEVAGAGATTDQKPYLGDNIAIAGTPVGTYNSKDVASASTVAYSGMTLSGAQAANYLLSIQTPSAATITPAHITSVSSIGSANKVYDGNTTAAINSGGAFFNGMVAGDGLSIAGGTANFSDRNVAPNKTVSIGGFTLAGTNASNYILDNNTALALANITQRSTVTYIGASGGDWATAANWEAGALPDLANVQNVVIPAGKTVNFTSDVARINGTVQIDGVTGAGTLNVGSGAVNVAHALNIGGYSQTGGAVGAESMAANASFNQTGGSLSVTKALGIQQAAGTVSLGNLTAATMQIGGGAGVRQVDGSAVVVRDGITLATGAGDAILGNANNNFNKIAVGSAHNATLKTKADSLAIGATAVSGDLVAGSAGAVTQTGTLSVQGATTIAAGGEMHLDDAANNLIGKVKLTSGADTSLAASGGLAIGGDIGGGLTLTSNGAVTQAGDPLHVTGATNIMAAGQAVTLADNANSFGGTLRLGAASATVNAAAPLDVTSEVTGAMTLTAPQLTVGAANALNLHVATTGAATVNADKALAIDGNVNGALVAKAGGAVTQGTAALTVGGASDIQAAGQTVVLANAGNDFGGDLKLAAASAQLADKNALSFASAAVTGNLQATAKGDVTQKGAMIVGGTTAIDTTGAVTLASAANDFTGAVSGSGSSFALRDATLLTVGKITAPQVDLTAGYGFQMTGSGIVDSPKVSLALTQLASNGSIGTVAQPFNVQNNASVTLGALTPAVPASFGGSGVQVSVTNGIALREYSKGLLSLEIYLGGVKAYNRVLDDFVSQNIVSLSKILRDAQKKADSSTDLIDNGMPIDLTERVAYPHAGSLKLKEPCKDSKDKACK